MKNIHLKTLLTLALVTFGTLSYASGTVSYASDTKINITEKEQFDHQHKAWTQLLKANVNVLRGGQASELDYAAIKKNHTVLKSYLASLSAVKPSQFNGWSKDQRKAFLMNAYNAFTVELILTKYPKLESIRDLGSLFSSPWSKEFVPLLGKTVTLDDIEHKMLRKPGAYDDPRVHFAVNCASIGCPPLREEAFVATRLNEQLNEQAKRFLSDRTRNRYNTKDEELKVSKIFDWYGGDFEKGHLGIKSLEQFFAKYAELLTDNKAAQDLIRKQEVDIEFLDYDWGLNDVSK